MNPFYLLIAIFMLTKKLVDFVFDGIASLFTVSNKPNVSSRGGVLDPSKIETYSDDENLKEENPNEGKSS